VAFAAEISLFVTVTKGLSRNKQISF